MFPAPGKLTSPVTGRGSFDFLMTKGLQESLVNLAPYESLVIFLIPSNRKSCFVCL